MTIRTSPAAGGPHPISQLAGRVLDVLLPRQCLCCAAVIEGGGLCPACFSRVTFTADPQCQACGLPFEFDAGGAALCGECAHRQPIYGRARAAFVYDDMSRAIVLAYKHGDRTDAAPILGRWLARAAGPLAADADLIVPVALHWTRLFSRRYNQAALLAAALGRETGLAVQQQALRRTRRTSSQGHLSRSARRRNVAGAFRVEGRARAGLDGKRVLLVDDVLTTGATVSACARALLRAGAAAVDVVTLARVVRPAVVSPAPW